MAKRCDICKRGPKKSVSRSHSNIANKRRQYLNLQKMDYKGEELKVCTKCMKTLYRTK
ncbi:MAG: L28 family ribosomal protein [Patescibacteria group bacterium]